MKLDIHPSWKNKLKHEFKKPYYLELMTYVDQEYGATSCYPARDKIFEAFSRATFENVKVVILGQDPYHGPHQAHGLCFSVQKETKIPASLKNIYKELQSDLQMEAPVTGNLENWANQGVLMLNTVLTVREGQAGSHSNKGWEKFTDAVIELISNQKEHVVFLLWGGPARKKGAKIDSVKHLVLTSGHPSPLSAIRGHWYGNKHFSQTNQYLINKGKLPIAW